MDVDGLIREAKEMIEFAVVELDEAKREHDEMRARQVCEKAYLALIKLTNAYLIKKGVKPEEIPKTERGRHFLLQKYADRDFRKEFANIRQYLHLDAFWNGIIIFDRIEEHLQDLEKVLERIKRM
jgi:uncharacterized protein (UPF0332 family)